MPELPEVETVRRILSEAVVGKKIRSLELLREKNVVTDPVIFKKNLPGKSIESIDRMGKFLLFRLSGELTMLSHLRMEGKWFEDSSGKLAKHDILRLHFDDGHSLIYNDVRKFGILGLYENATLLKESPLKELGKEPWDISPEELYAGIKKKRNAPIKEALLDQGLISGLGNIYADETCFACHLDPRTPCSLITSEDCKRIKDEVSRIMKEAIIEGGSTIKSYHPKDGVSGKMQNRLLAYNHKNEPCPYCGFKMHKITVGGRGTTYCPKCQKSRQNPFVLAVTGPIHSGKSIASKYFEEKGYVRLDCDELIAKLYKDEETLTAIKKAFGTNDKNKLRKLIAGDEKKNQALKDILYPRLKALLLNELSNIGSGKNVVLEVQILPDSGLEDLVDEVILVVADDNVRKQRLINEGKDADGYMKLNASYPLSKSKNLATYVIVNDGNIDDFKAKLDNV
ncbi:MAG: DNA-formamidopyrimidine glycosylase [Bacillota bacterium]|nr:DNA-formamidopyrimidine glycosylase [Bacillota bacterium]